jgi:hypothetical protein
LLAVLGEGGCVMDWKLELDALIENTMAFANHAKRKPIPDLPIALETAEQTLAETPRPVAPPASITLFPASERDEIRQRVITFRAHQEKMAREREQHYLQVRARMMPQMVLLDDQKENP